MVLEQEANFLNIQGGPKVLERLAKLELVVAGSTFDIHHSKFKDQNNLESYIDFEILEGIAQKLNLPHPILALLTVQILLGHPVEENCIHKEYLIYGRY